MFVTAWFSGVSKKSAKDAQEDVLEPIAPSPHGKTSFG